MQNNHNILKYKTVSSPDILGIQCNIQTLTESYPVHRHEFYELEYITQGICKQIINGNDYTFNNSNFYFLSPNDFHLIEPTTQKICFNNISFNLSELPKECLKLLVNLPTPLIGTLENEEKELFERLFLFLTEEIFNSSKLQKDLIISASILLVNLIHKNANIVSKKLANNQKLSYINAAVDYIENNYQNQLDLKIIAKILNLSESYLSRIFTQIMCCSLTSYLNLIRIKNSCYLIKTTDLSITEIAFNCGFGSFANFSRTFKKLVGMSPLEYKKSL